MKRQWLITVTMIILVLLVAGLEGKPGQPQTQKGQAPAPRAIPESPPEGVPVRGTPDPGIKANFLNAKPLAVNQVTEIEHTSKETWDADDHWFRVQVETARPVVLRVLVLNTRVSWIHAYDGAGAWFERSDIREKQNRPSAWHLWVSAGTYFFYLKDYREPDSDMRGAPAILVMVDPVGPGKTPQQTAQLGLNYLEMDAPAWQNAQECNGCHVQSQALMGMALAKKNGYVVQDRSALALGEFMATQKALSEGRVGEGLFAALAHRYYVSGFAPSHKELLHETAKAIVEKAPEGYAFDSGDRAPIEGGTVTGSSMAVQVLAEALRTAPPESQAGMKKVLDGAVSFLRTAPAQTVQDYVMKILAFKEASVEGEFLAREVAALLKLQNDDGGFGELPQGGPSNAYGTGQALYGLKVAGTSITSPAFERAVKWLVFNQSWDGSWPLKGSELQNNLAPTMWAVIGLAGSIRVGGNVGEVRVKFAPEVQAISNNLEIILDASGSMNTKLGKSTRFGAAKEVLADLVKQLPPDINVALRVFGHRKGGPESCEDTELLVPLARVVPQEIIARVNAAGLPSLIGVNLVAPQEIMAKVNALRAKGETPLVANLRLAAGDLASAKAGMIVAITDGEESCGGDLKNVPAQLKAQGVQTVVNIVGFNLPTAKAIADWKLVAQSTGGRFFDAKTAGELSAALREAVQLKYAALDHAGQEVGSAQVGEPLRIPEGTYAIVVRTGRPVKVEGVKVSEKEPATLELRWGSAGWILEPEKTKP